MQGLSPGISFDFYKEMMISMRLSAHIQLLNRIFLDFAFNNHDSVCEVCQIMHRHEKRFDCV